MTEQQTVEKTTRKQKRQSVRKYPIRLRMAIFLVLSFIAVLVGTMIGYSVLGDGSAFSVFRPSTWTHIFDLYRGVE